MEQTLAQSLFGKLSTKGFRSYTVMQVRDCNRPVHHALARPAQASRRSVQQAGSNLCPKKGDEIDLLKAELGRLRSELKRAHAALYIFEKATGGPENSFR